jgi:ComF family protein
MLGEDNFIFARFIRGCWQKIIQAILPPTCLLCLHHCQNNFNVCKTCLRALPSLLGACSQCANKITAPVCTRELICGTCLTNPPPFERTFALFQYKGALLTMVKQLKFHQHLAYAQTFSQLMLQAIQQDWYPQQPLPDLILAIPLHYSRLRERGFNQSLEIAKPIARNLSIPLDLTPKRIKATLPQSSLSAKARTQNIKQAFEFSRNYTHLHLAVVDDVYTTGATLSEFTRCLAKLGAKQIDIWCCARNI